MNEPTVLYGDNMGVILNATNPLAQCKKKHNALSFHRVREAVAKSIINPKKIKSNSIINPKKIDSNDNYADIFTKVLDPHTFERMRAVIMNIKPEYFV